MSREWFTRFRLRIRALLLRRRLDRDLEDELQFHLAMRREKGQAAGLAAVDAQSSARRRFGNATLLKEACRELWTFASLETFSQDVRFGARMLRKSPAFTAIAVFTLALGIGVNATVFTVVDAVLFRRPPVRDPGRLMVVSSVDPAASPDSDLRSVSAPDYLDWRAQNTSFSRMTAASYDSFTISGGANPQRAPGARVSPDFFQVLGVEPVLGRAILPGRSSAAP